jgi:hypothetical protein
MRASTGAPKRAPTGPSCDERCGSAACCRRDR